MKTPTSLLALVLAGAAILPAAAQTATPSQSYSLGTSTQGAFPSRPERVDFGPPPVPGTQAAVASQDARTLAAVTAALTTDPTLNGAEIDVVVSDGNVVISGTAMNEAQAAYAKGVAVGVAGAGNVEGVVATQ